MQGEKKKAVEICRGKRNFLLISHIDPDGDAIGSLLALGLSLQRAGKRVIMANPHGVPQVFRFLPGWREVRSEYGELAVGELADLEVVVTLDTATEERLGDWGQVLKDSSAAVLNIDHHLTNTRYGHVNWIEATSSTGELVQALLSKLGWEIEADIALCLYTAIVTDTGSFRYENTTYETHCNVAALLQRGINPAQATEYIYETRREAAVRLLGRALETLQLSPDGRIAWLTITASTLAAVGARGEDVNGIVNYAKEIAGVEVGILFQETGDGAIKVSLRSRPSGVNVSDIAQNFGGGGHPRAAGCLVQGSLDQVQEKVLAVAAAALAGREKAGARDS
ncbi:MAG: bifunctional oligoribonuclease/PAP phosphatase NrnA [bacterium]|jgi:phosphoesterase RecJ-like protein|nr:bifunctional oligoribonuclease/PAP phosphatase NrnA [Bacillota bacterium]HHW55911.1 bifunctional oligoribonuclease/PAP phosphatase NrnA [Bacillota bacterium]